MSASSVDPAVAAGFTEPSTYRTADRPRRTARARREAQHRIELRRSGWTKPCVFPAVLTERIVGTRQSGKAGSRAPEEFRPTFGYPASP